MEKKLEVKDLQISFKTQGGNVKAVRNISFDLYKGETLAIVGESGSGKSVTSKAIIGILAGNSIVEGGEILYDGQDLLKISEEDFHKIRGDKISMIFQDPLSSLNPIVRVGKQLTEAMILNGRSSQKNARKQFNKHLALLKENLNLVDGETKESQDKNALMCKTFDNFCIESTKLEHAYNDAQASAIDLSSAIDDIAFMLIHKQKIDLKKRYKNLLRILTRTYHPYVLHQTEELASIIEEINRVIELPVENLPNNEEVISFTKKFMTIVDSAIQSPKPNYFTLGYYMYKNPDSDISSYSVADLDVMTRKYLDDNYMLEFIDYGANGLFNSFETSINNKKEALPLLIEAKEYFSQTEIARKKSMMYFDEISKSVLRAIDRLAITKKSLEYSLKNALHSAINSYFTGIKKNPAHQASYERKMKKYEKLVAKGKKPSWMVIPPVLVDLELTKGNIVKMLSNLIESYQKDIDNVSQYDKHNSMISFIDYMKDQASRVVYHITKRIAKAKALKLLEEVGIPEPKIRYNQFPFEFSGGMRQRIVIAIALSANPDILICDEPTTALDVTIQSQILELINRIKEERHLSVIFITHDLGVVANMADRIAIMYAGKIVEYGKSEEIFYNPCHPYTWALLSSIPDLDTKEKLEAIPGTPPNMIYPPKGDAFAERNKYALEIDFEQQPPLFEVTPTHFAATWLLHPNAPKVNPPKIVTNRIMRMKPKEAPTNE